MSIKTTICSIVLFGFIVLAVPLFGNAASVSPKKATTNATEVIFMGRRVKLQKGGGDFADVLNEGRKKADEREMVPPHEPDDEFMNLNGEKLSWGAIDRRIDLLLRNNPLDIPPEATPEQRDRVVAIARRKLAERVANRYVRDALLAQKAKAMGMTVSTNELGAAFESAVQKVSRRCRADVMADMHSPESCFYREQENYLLTKKYREKVLASGISVSEEEIFAAIKERNDTIATLTASNAMMRPRMEKWLAEIKAGTRDFGKTAYDFSDCPSSMNDGVMGNYDRDCSLVRPLKEFAFSTSTNSVLSEVLESKEAYHILKILGRRYNFDDDGQDIEFDDDDDDGKVARKKDSTPVKPAQTGRRPTTVTLAQIMLEKHKIPAPLARSEARTLVFKRKLADKTFTVQYDALKNAALTCAVPVKLLRNTERKIRRKAAMKEKGKTHEKNK